MSPLRVSFVSSHALHGGAELQLSALVDQLAPDWIAGIVVLAEGPLCDRLRAQGHAFKVIPTPARTGILAAALKLRRVLAAQRPDVVHADGVKAAVVCAIATLGTGMRVVWRKVDYSRDGLLARAVARRCALVVGVTRGVTDTFGPSLSERVRVVPNGLPRYEFDRASAHAAVAQLLGGDRGGPTLIHMGRLHPRKGHMEAIEILPQLLDHEPRLRLLLLSPAPDGSGEAAYAGAIRARIRKLGVEHAVSLVTNHHEPVRLLAGCDVLLVPSVPDPASGWREGFGLVAAEAMAVGTVVTGYADGALPEVVDGCGRLVPTRDREALRDAILVLLADDALRGRLVELGLERSRAYSMPRMVEGMKACYAEAASR